MDLCDDPTWWSDRQPLQVSCRNHDGSVPLPCGREVLTSSTPQLASSPACFGVRPARLQSLASNYLVWTGPITPVVLGVRLVYCPGYVDWAWPHLLPPGWIWVKYFLRSGTHRAICRILWGGSLLTLPSLGVAHNLNTAILLQYSHEFPGGRKRRKGAIPTISKGYT